MTNSPPSASDGGASPGLRAYEALHPEVRRWIREQGWTALRPVQAEAIPAVLASDADVLISAGTAAGKTEAAFLPVLTRVAEEARGGLSVLYVAPLKALINDQYGRLEQLAERLTLPVVRWHGDAPQAAKNRIAANPRGIVLITPESIEAMFLRRAASARALFGSLRFIIVDEVHAFLAGIRGKHLASLLCRVDALGAAPARRIGLSATIGDLPMAAEWLRPGAGETVRILEPDTGGPEVRIQVRGYLQPMTSKVAGDKGAADRQKLSVYGLEAIADHMYDALRGSNNLAFGGSRSRVELLADTLRRRCEQEGVPNEFFPHHGNLSGELREDVEARLKKGALPTTAVCTSTLELGIDIGSVVSVAQVGAPRSLSALRQRLGRSGRRVGVPAILRIYVLEHELDADPDPLDDIRHQVVRAVAAVRLLVARFIEPPSDAAGMATVLLHQVLSILSERGGARADALYRALCGTGPFRSVSSGTFVRLLRAMGGQDARLIEQAPDGLLMLGEVGEQLVASRDFFALFETAEEWRLVTGGRTLGTIPLSNIVAVDNLVIFAGRRWVVVGVDEKAHVIEVRPHQGGAPPSFEDVSIEPVHDRLAQEMLAVYREGTVPSWLDATAAQLLTQGYDAFRRHQMATRRIIVRGQECHLMTWRGDSVNGVLAVALQVAGLQAESHDLGVTVHGADEGSIRGCLESFAMETPDVATLAAKVSAFASAKFDHLLPDDMLREFWASANSAHAALLPELAAGLLVEISDQHGFQRR